MSKEFLFIRILQIAVTCLTVVLAYGIYCVKNGQVKKHKQINFIVVIITFIAVAVLLFTLVLGFDYKRLCSPQDLFIHRCFSTPLFFSLIFTTYYGWRNKNKLHKFYAKISLFLWLGSLISAWIIFNNT